MKSCKYSDLSLWTITKTAIYKSTVSLRIRLKGTYWSVTAERRGRGEKRRGRRGRLPLTDGTLHGASLCHGNARRVSERPESHWSDWIQLTNQNYRSQALWLINFNQSHRVYNESNQSTPIIALLLSRLSSMCVFDIVTSMAVVQESGSVSLHTV